MWSHFWNIPDTITGFTRLIDDENLAFSFADMQGLIPKRTICPNCNAQTIIIKANSKKFGAERACNACRRRYSILQGTVFYKTKISIGQLLLVLYMWAYCYPCSTAAHESKVSGHTITRLFKIFRKACCSFIESNPSPLIGGPGLSVEVDETFMSQAKYHRGRQLLQIWIFGGICRETREIFAQVVPRRDSDTLMQVISDNIAIGTTIITDGFSSYKCLDKTLPQPYPHLSVNHKEEFVNYTTGAHTQSAERLWREIKRAKRRYEGVMRNEIPRHLCEFVWRRRAITPGITPFQAAITLMASVQLD